MEEPWVLRHPILSGILFYVGLLGLAIICASLERRYFAPPPIRVIMVEPTPMENQ